MYWKHNVCIKAEGLAKQQLVCLPLKKKKTVFFKTAVVVFYVFLNIQTATGTQHLTGYIRGHIAGEE